MGIIQQLHKEKRSFHSDWSVFFLSLVGHPVPERTELAQHLFIILYGECPLAVHQDGVVDTFERLPYARLSESVAKVKSASPLPLLRISAHLVGRLHIENVRTALVFLYQHRKNLLPPSLSAQFVAHGKIPEPVERLPRIDDGEAHELTAVVIRREIQRHPVHKHHQVLVGYLLLHRKSRFVQCPDLSIERCRRSQFLCFHNLSE